MPYQIVKNSLRRCRQRLQRVGAALIFGALGLAALASALWPTAPGPTPAPPTLTVASR